MDMGCGASANVPHSQQNESNQLLLPVIDSTRSSLEPREDFQHKVDTCKPTAEDIYGAELSDRANDAKDDDDSVYGTGLHDCTDEDLPDNMMKREQLYIPKIERDMQGIKKCDKKEGREKDGNDEALTVWEELDCILTGRLDDMKNHVDNLLGKTTTLREEIYNVLYQLQEENKEEGENTKEMCCQCLDMFFTDNFIQEVIDRRRSTVMSTVVDSVSVEIDRILTRWLEETSNEINEQVKNVNEFAEKVDCILVEMKDKGLITNHEYIALRRESSELMM